MQDEGLPLRGLHQEVHQGLALRLLRPKRLLRPQVQEQHDDNQVQVKRLDQEDWLQSQAHRHRII